MLKNKGGRKVNRKVFFSYFFFPGKQMLIPKAEV